ncbi:MAG: signal peptidase I [Candidatus Hydrothermarchaeota archaeon]|nr:signal peptidase I [Candidatus Hydrothermarchaeota archaeon]
MDLKKELKETVLYIVIGIVLAYGINTGLGYALDTDKPVMAVVSSSMEPTFYKGDLVVVKGIEPEKIAVGDVIVYHNPFRGVSVVHRVIEIKKINSGLYFYTKGDNSITNQLSDQESGIAPPIREEWIKGRLILVIPKLGWFRVALSNLS